MHMDLSFNSQITYLFGSNIKEINALNAEPFNELACDFVSDLSKILINDPDTKKYQDVLVFAFWCRRSNLSKFKERVVDKNLRVGRGIAFHITPANVPINFAYSLIISILSGNSNIVRVSSKYFEQVNIICQALNKLILEERYILFKKFISIIQYDHSEEITRFLSSICDVRVIWGGDNAIKNIKQISIPPRSLDICFSDRYSISAINSDFCLNLSSEELEILAGKLYNDVYYMNQQACSSPHVIFWVGPESSSESLRERFWPILGKIAKQNYAFEPINSVDKFALLCNMQDHMCNLKLINQYGNYLYHIELKGLSNNLDSLRGAYGILFESKINDLDEISAIVTPKYQTLSYFGFSKGELKSFVTQGKLHGVDRVVPIGQALDMDVIWDGFDLINTFSRVVSII